MNDPLRPRILLVVALLEALVIALLLGVLLGPIILGAVADGDGRALKGRVTAFDAHDQLRGTEVRDDGAFALAGVDPGDWKVTCEAEGYERAEIQVRVPDGQVFVRQGFTLVATFVLAVVDLI